MTPEQSAEATFSAQQAIEAFLEDGLSYKDIRDRMTLAKQGANRKPNGQEGYERWMRYFNAMMEILDVLHPQEKRWTVDDIKQGIDNAIERYNTMHAKVEALAATGIEYGEGNTEFDSLCDEEQAMFWHIDSMTAELRRQEAFTRNKRLCKIACSHVPGSKWPDESEFNFVRQTITSMLCGSYGDNRKYTKEEIILHAQERKEEIFEHGIYTDFDEMELLIPYVMYNMAQDLPD